MVKRRQSGGAKARGSKKDPFVLPGSLTLAERQFPEPIPTKFEVVSAHHASTILQHDFPEEYADLVEVLSRFTVPYTQIIVGGGGKGEIAGGFDAQLYAKGWHKKNVSV